jgi:DNA-binding response OmpR family regulator
VGGKRILVVDDDPGILRTVSRILREAGYEVHASRHPTRAVRLAACVRPSLAILDVSMPRLSGFDLAQDLQAGGGTSKIPCMFLTAQGTGDNIEQAREVRARGYLEKPFRKEALLAVVRQILHPDPA